MAKKHDPRLTFWQAKRIDAARRHGAGMQGAPSLGDETLCRIIGFIERDLAGPDILSELPAEARPEEHYYLTPLNLDAHIDRRIDVDFPGLYIQAAQEIEDFERAFESLCEIHKRRIKFAHIMATQPMPEIEELAHRGVLELALAGPAATASTIRWRKFLYDIDNRAAQEAGYLFMKIMANALGGKGHSSSTSPIRRAGHETKRRPVDCIAGNMAYDFKARMTEAPSGRVRFDDETAFPRDCEISGYRPILLVLHQLLGPRSQELVEAYETFGGNAFIGDEAWRHVRERAGVVMANFIDTYLFSRLDELNREEGPVMDMTLRIRNGRLEQELSYGSDSSALISHTRMAG